LLTATKRRLRFFAFTIITIGFLGFAVANRQFIHISLFPLPYAAEMPEFIFAILCFALGCLVGWGFTGLKLSKSKRLLKTEHQYVMALQNEISGLHAKGVFLVVDGAPREMRACVYLERRGARVYLGMLAVHPAQQKRGLGRLLMSECERRCRAWGATAIDIRIVNRRTELPPIYLQMGFVDRGTQPFEDPLLKKPCHFILMSKDLE